MITRREFVRDSILGAGSVVLSRHSPLMAASGPNDARVEVLLGEPLGTISPDLYGHFTEHLGGVIYDGIWGWAEFQGAQC